MTRIMSLYIHGDHALLHAHRQTSSGFWVPCDPYFKIDKLDLTTICEKLTHLTSIKADVVTENEPARRLQPLLELAGSASWKTFAKSSKLVLVEANEGTLRLIPQVFDPKTTAFTDGPDVVTIRADELDSFETKIEEALALCNSK